MLSLSFEYSIHEKRALNFQNWKIELSIKTRFFENSKSESRGSLALEWKPFEEFTFKPSGEVTL